MTRLYKKSLHIFSIMSVLIIIMLLSATSAHADSQGQSYMKIGLAYGTSAPSTATISSSSTIAILNVAGGGGEFTDLGVSSVVVSLSGGSVAIADKNGNVLSYVSGDGNQLLISSDYTSRGTHIFYGKSEYRGGIIPYKNSNGNLNIINYVKCDDYIRGVLHAEIGQSSHIEAIKAQAVAARSYALSKKDYHKSQGFDLCTTSHCQSYKGVASEYESTNRAVDETSGLLMYYNGSIAAGYYHANSGGHTANCEDVWSAALGYLRGKVDEYSPDYSWQVVLTKDQLDAATAARGIGPVKSVSIDSYDSSGYVSSFTVNGTTSSVTVKKENIRSIFGSTATLKSRVFTLSTEGGSLSSEGSGAAGGNDAYYAYTSSGLSRLDDSVYVLSSSGMSKMSLNGLVILDGAGNKTTASVQAASPTDGLVSQIVYLNNGSDKLIINGHGYGHGIGLSQQGAQAMGKLGFTYDQILKYYYTDIEIR